MNHLWPVPVGAHDPTILIMAVACMVSYLAGWLTGIWESQQQRKSMDRLREAQQWRKWK